MKDNLSIVITMLVFVVLIVIFPLYNYFERQDDMSYNLALKETTAFVDEILNCGYINQQMYDKYVDNLANTGNFYDIQLESHEKVLSKENNDTKSIYNEQYKISYNKDIFKEDDGKVKSNISDKYIKDGCYYLNEGDQFYVRLKNTNTTMAGAIFNTIVPTAKKERIVVDYGGIVKNTAWNLVRQEYNALQYSFDIDIKLFVKNFGDADYTETQNFNDIILNYDTDIEKIIGNHIKGETVNLTLNKIKSGYSIVKVKKDDEVLNAEEGNYSFVVNDSYTIGIYVSQGSSQLNFDLKYFFNSLDDSYEIDSLKEDVVKVSFNNGENWVSITKSNFSIDVPQTENLIVRIRFEDGDNEEYTSMNYVKKGEIENEILNNEYADNNTKVVTTINYDIYLKRKKYDPKDIRYEIVSKEQEGSVNVENKSNFKIILELTGKRIPEVSKFVANLVLYYCPENKQKRKIDNFDQIDGKLAFNGTYEYKFTPSKKDNCSWSIGYLDTILGKNVIEAGEKTYSSEFLGKGKFEFDFIYENDEYANDLCLFIERSKDEMSDNYNMKSISYTYQFKLFVKNETTNKETSIKYIE